MPRRAPRPVDSAHLVRGSPTVHVDSFGDIPPGPDGFLTHMHADHYNALSARHKGLVFATPPTARLARHILNVSPGSLRLVEPVPHRSLCAGMITGTACAPPENGSPPLCPHGGGAACSAAAEAAWHRVRGDAHRVLALDANHCPGACLFLFRNPLGLHLHTGDMRFEPEGTGMVHSFGLLAGKLATLHLDTTYAASGHDFPPQRESLAAAEAEVAREMDAAAREGRPRPAFLFGSYTIGKERLVLHCARRFGERIAVTARKHAILTQCLSADDMSLFFVPADASERRRAVFHLVPMHAVSLKALKELELEPAGRTRVGFRPTGWTFRGGADSGAVASRSVANGAAAGTRSIVSMFAAMVRNGVRAAYGVGGGGGGGSTNASEAAEVIQISDDDEEDGEDGEDGEDVVGSEEAGAGAGANVAPVFRRGAWQRAHGETSTSAALGRTSKPRGPKKEVPVAHGKRSRNTLAPSTRAGLKSGRAVAVGIAYSEHSSLEELRQCVDLLRPRHIVPTVNHRRGPDVIASMIASVSAPPRNSLR